MVGKKKSKLVKFKIVITYDEKCKKAREESKKAGRKRSSITIKVRPKVDRKLAQNVMVYALNWMLTGDPDALERYVKEITKMPVGVV